VRRYIITGAPGAGKTTLLAALHAQGYPVVGEAATDLIERRQALGHMEPLHNTGFIDAITLLQRIRQQRPVPPRTAVQLYDRSPICTLALAHYLGLPISRTLAGEVNRVLDEEIYQPRVFFVRLLGFITPTAVRRITLAQAVRFERYHEQAYHTHGYELVEVPSGTVAERAELIEQHIRSRV
jgi:predicted ATPase